MTDDARWQTYLRQFHRDRAGVTQNILSAARSANGTDPYQWALSALPVSGRVLDLACGSAPTYSPALRDRYLGVDTSSSELSLAACSGARPLVRADAAAIALADRSVSAVMCSMSLMIVPRLDDVLREIRRVLVPGGVLAATVPTGAPLRAWDAPIAAGLLVGLGRRLHYPNDPALADAPALFARARLRVHRDERVRFGYPLSTAESARMLAASLYLPAIGRFRMAAATAYLRALARIRAEIPIPIRRIVAVAQ